MWTDQKRKSNENGRDGHNSRTLSIIGRPTQALYGTGARLRPGQHIFRRGLQRTERHWVSLGLRAQRVRNGRLPRRARPTRPTTRQRLCGLFRRRRTPSWAGRRARPGRPRICPGRTIRSLPVTPTAIFPPTMKEMPPLGIPGCAAPDRPGHRVCPRADGLRNL